MIHIAAAARNTAPITEMRKRCTGLSPREMNREITAEHAGDYTGDKVGDQIAFLRHACRQQGLERAYERP